MRQWTHCDQTEHSPCDGPCFLPCLMLGAHSRASPPSSKHTLHPDVDAASEATNRKRMRRLENTDNGGMVEESEVVDSKREERVGMLVSGLHSLKPAPLRLPRWIGLLKKRRLHGLHEHLDERRLAVRLLAADPSRTPTSTARKA